MTPQRRILIVEDSADDAELAARALRLSGCELTYERVETPEAMEAALARAAWDVVIADYSMPHFNGLAALKLLQKQGLDLPFTIRGRTAALAPAARSAKAAWFRPPCREVVHTGVPASGIAAKTLDSHH